VLEDGSFRYMTDSIQVELPMPALIGDHQYINAATAITAALELGLDGNAIASGLANVKWPSRLEMLERSYVPAGFELWIDGAHNAAGAYVISNYIREKWKDRPVYIIFGTTQGRDVAGFLKYFDFADEVVLSKIAAEPASYEAEDMERELGGSYKKFPCLKDAVSSFSGKPAGRILCLGSLFMRGDVPNL
jgi:dihydrofolate synthase/folylpolyglutamate synthase